MALEVDADVIGINNRNLEDFSVDIQRTFDLLADVPAGKTVVSESGIHHREQIEELEQVGVDAVLIGETLMRATDPEARRARAEPGRGADAGLTEPAGRLVAYPYHGAAWRPCLSSTRRGRRAGRAAARQRRARGEGARPGAARRAGGASWPRATC